MDLKMMEVGETKTSKNVDVIDLPKEILAGVDEAEYKNTFGLRFRKKDIVKVSNSLNKSSEFRIRRIIGKNFVLLEEGRHKSAKLSLMETYLLIRLLVTGKF